MHRARERSDLLELADQRARAATLELELQHLREAAAAAPPVVDTLVAPPSITTPAPVTPAMPINTPPVVTVAQLVNTSVPSTPLSTHPGLHSLTGTTTSAAALLGQHCSVLLTSTISCLHCLACQIHLSPCCLLH